MSAKYKKYFDMMLEEQSEAFDEFKKAYENYQSDPKSREIFDDSRRRVLRIISKYEDQLCSKTEVSKYSSFTQSLSEKYWELIRQHFPYIDNSVIQES